MFVDESSLLRQLYPTAVIVLTWVCTSCHRGWPAPAGRFVPRCGRCGQHAEQRGAHAAIPLTSQETQCA